MEKLSFKRAVSKTNLLLTSRKGIFAVYALLFIALDVWQDSFSVGTEEAALNFLGLTLLGMLLQIFIDLSLSHFTVASLRNRTSFFPANPLWEVFRYYSYAFVLFLGLSVLFAAGLIIASLCLPSASDVPLTVMTETLGIQLYLVMAPIALLAAILIARYIFVFFPVAMGDDLGLKDSWRMSRGYTIKLTLVIVLMGVTSWGVQSGFEAVFPAKPGEFSIIVSILSNTLTAGICLWANTYFGVLYQDLYENYSVDSVLSGKNAPVSVHESTPSSTQDS